MDDKPEATVTTTLLPVVEEVLHVGIRTVDRGGAAVHIHVSENDEVVERLLRQDVLSVERVSVGRVVDAVPPVREEGDVTIIPVMEEQIVVTKRLLLTEEIHVRRQHKVTPWKSTITLRKETATVEPIATGLAEPSGLS